MARASDGRTGLALTAMVGALACGGDGVPSATGRAGYGPGDTMPVLHLHGQAHGKDSTGDTVFSSDEVVNEVPPSPGRYLVVHVTLPSCHHCATETQEEKALVRDTHGAVRVVQVLAQNLFSDPPTYRDLASWTALRESALPIGIDVDGELVREHGRSAYFMLVRTQDHRVVSAGEGRDAFRAIQDVLLRNETLTHPVMR